MAPVREKIAKHMLEESESYRRLDDDARVWIYQADRALTDKEAREIRSRGQVFVSGWAAHGAPLDAALEVFHHHFVVIVADEKQVKASGCSIDRSVGFIRELEQDLSVSLLDWRTVVYRKGDKIVSTSREQFEVLLSRGEVGPDTRVFNNFLSKKVELETEWEVPLRDSQYNGLL